MKNERMYKKLKYELTGFRNIHPTFVEYYAKEHGFHISPMKVLTQ